MVKKEKPKKQDNKKDSPSLSSAEYERVGRIMESVFLSGYANRSRFLWMAFAKGVISGIGSVIGATIVIALLLWLLSAVDTLPFIGPIAESLENTIESSGPAQ